MKQLPAATTRRPQKNGFDAVSFLSIYIFLFAAVPSYLTIPALGSIGRLSVLWGLAGIVWWSVYKVQLSLSDGTTSNPVKIATLLLICTLGISYALANLHGLPSSSSTTADSSLMRVASWAGVTLVALDGIHDRERFMTLLRRFVLAGGLMAGLGIAQFVTGQSLVDSLTLPGFAISQDVQNTQERGAFTRAAGTATHPLEYGSLLCMVLPLAIALAITDRKRPRWRRSWPVIVIMLAVVLSVSRSALIGVFVGLVLLAPGIPAKVRWISMGIGAVAMTAMAFIVPGLLGTLRGLFISLSSDSSILSRTNSIDDAVAIAFRNPAFGKGFGTFLPTELILDNQYLLVLIEGGLIGIAALLAVMVVSMISGWRTLAITESPDRKIIGAAAAAGMASVLVLLAFFDGLSFPITAGGLFVMVGICGVLLELELTERRDKHGPDWRPGPWLRRNQVGAQTHKNS